MSDYTASETSSVVDVSDLASFDDVSLKLGFINDACFKR